MRIVSDILNADLADLPAERLLRGVLEYRSALARLAYTSSTTADELRDVLTGQLDALEAELAARGVAAEREVGWEAVAA